MVRISSDSAVTASDSRTSPVFPLYSQEEVHNTVSLKSLFKRDPFQFTAHAEWQNGSLQTEVTLHVPNNKLLVIEHVSASLHCPVGQEITHTQVRTSVKSVLAWHNVFIPKTTVFNDGGSPPTNVYSGGQGLRLYADPGTTVVILVGKNSSQIPDILGGGTDVYISGYLLPLKSPNVGP